jgi:DNA-binding NtrC family response regulator
MAATLLTPLPEILSMDLRPRVLIVADTPALTEDLFGWLVPEGYQAIVATTFASAMSHLRAHPQLVISQLRLGAYNGLHVALRARGQGIPAVVIGHSDTVLEREARQLGATYVRSAELVRERIVEVARELTSSEMAVEPGPGPVAPLPGLVKGEAYSPR